MQLKIIIMFWASRMSSSEIRDFEKLMLLIGFIIRTTSCLIVRSIIHIDYTRRGRNVETSKRRNENDDYVVDVFTDYDQK